MPEYQAWKGMIKRCYNVNQKDYPNYGGRGIKVDEKFKVFEGFFAVLGKKPTKGHSLERINVNGDYAPDNCKWATSVEQSLNRRNNHKITYNGKTLTLTEWAIKMGLTPQALFSRVNTYKWSLDRALNQPLKRRIDNG